MDNQEVETKLDYISF